MANQIHVHIVAVEESIWAGDADMLVARTTEGELGVMAGHAPLLGQLKEPSEVRVNRPEGHLAWEVSGGFLSVGADGVTVLAGIQRQLASTQLARSPALVEGVLEHVAAAPCLLESGPEVHEEAAPFGVDGG